MPVHGDRELLTQLVVNLLESAIRHCPPGTEITLSIVVADDEAVATFAHNGPSIPVDERDTVPGSGFGRSLVRAIADLHGSKVELSDNGPGLRSGVTLPLSLALGDR